MKGTYIAPGPLTVKPTERRPVHLGGPDGPLIGYATATRELPDGSIEFDVEVTNHPAVLAALRGGTRAFSIAEPEPELIADSAGARQALGEAVAAPELPHYTRNPAGPFSAGIEPPVRIRTDEAEQ